ncbi:MAG TPA: D-alanyl-D-alanine carboxypeptidase family protein [Bacillota bacterium]|nr:D-alanyl-D-alanine carboxypeptidase family protein [Bacillota bacterium]
MKRYVKILFVICFFTFYPTNTHANEQLFVSAEHAILFEQSTGNILFEKNAHEKTSVASITKVMTAIIALEYGILNEVVEVSERALNVEGSSIYLLENEKMTLKDLLYGLILRSGNDAAIAISEHIGGSVEAFVYLMNEKAKWIGMTNTNFQNPHGLEEENHYSTAYDMALLYRYASENELFQSISNTKAYLSENRIYKWHNKNKLLTSLYEYSTGGKTGFTKKAGRTLISSAEKGDLSLIAVTLNAPDDWRDHMRMFEWGFQQNHLTSFQLHDHGVYDRSLYSLIKSNFRDLLGLYHYD